MVAYSFQKRFAARIEDGTKRHTIRADRRRHARPGEALQLYVGMRTKHCRKIIADPVCKLVAPLAIQFDLGRQPLISRVVMAGETIRERDLDIFAVRDGFDDLDDMSAFWRASHPVTPGFVFNGVLIDWGGFYSGRLGV